MAVARAKARSATKGKHWTHDEEIEFALSIIEEMLPRGANDWSRVASTYNATRRGGMSEKDDEKIKNKFKS